MRFRSYPGASAVTSEPAKVSGCPVSELFCIMLLLRGSMADVAPVKVKKSKKHHRSKGICC